MFNSQEFVHYLAAALDGVACCPLDTVQIIAALESLGLTLDPDINPEASRSGHERRQNPTSPGDMSWLTNDSCIALAWGGGTNDPGSVPREFEKLLLAKEHWKLLITGGSGSGTPQSLRPTLERRLKKHNDGRRRETYVWIDFRCNPVGCALGAFEFVVETDGRQNPIFSQVGDGSFKYFSRRLAASGPKLERTAEQQSALISEITELQARSYQLAQLLKILPAERHVQLKHEMQRLFLSVQTLRLEYARLIQRTDSPKSSE